MVNRFIPLLLLLLCSFSSAAITQLTASIDKNPVAANQSFILTVQADAKMSGAALDTKALLRNFVVGNTQTSSQTQIINGNINHATTWTILLITRTPGKYIIPAFSIDGVSSRPISVTIVEPSKNTGQNDKNSFLETTVDNKTVYLQSTIQFTTKLYLAYDIQRGTLSQPAMENANIRQIGKSDEESNEVRDGIRYRVVTRTHAITPQRSGTYSISAPIFNGELVVNKRRSFFSGFNNTKPISLIGDSIEITVKPIPDEYSGQWLPSEMVVLGEEWQPSDGGYKVGDPITRIITLNAIGVSEEQLPELAIDYPAGVKAYPDQSSLNSATRNNQLLAQRKDSVALVPSKAGQLTFPEVRVPWWNTRTNTMEYATLPAKTVTVEPSDNAVYAQPVPIAAPAIVPIGNPELATITIKEVQVNSYLTWAFLTAWILTALFWMVHIRHLKNKGLPAKVKVSNNSGSSERACWNDFEAACKADDPIKANQQLQRWGRASWPEQSFTSSMEVASFIDNDEVIAAVNELQKHLYGAQSNKWQGKNLLSVTGKNKSPKAVKESDGLQPLHPT